MSWIRESDGSFFEACIVAFKIKGPLLGVEGVTAQSHNLDFQSFSKFSYPTSISLLWARSWEFFCVFWFWKPCFGNLENPTNSCTNTTYQKQAYPLPGSSGAWRQKWITSMPDWHPAISCSLGHHLHLYLSGVRISSCWHITFFTTESLKSLFDSCEALFMSVSYIWPLQTKPTSNSQLQFLTELLG